MHPLQVLTQVYTASSQCMNTSTMPTVPAHHLRLAPVLSSCLAQVLQLATHTCPAQPSSVNSNTTCCASRRSKHAYGMHAVHTSTRQCFATTPWQAHPASTWQAHPAKAGTSRHPLALQINACSDDRLADGKREIEALQKLSHPNVLRLLDSCVSVPAGAAAAPDPDQLVADRYVYLLFPAYQVCSWPCVAMLSWQLLLHVSMLASF
jgi:hypothetical protein